MDDYANAEHTRSWWFADMRHVIWTVFKILNIIKDITFQCWKNTKLNSGDIDSCAVCQLLGSCWVYLGDTSLTQILDLHWILKNCSKAAEATAFHGHGTPHGTIESARRCGSVVGFWAAWEDEQSLLGPGERTAKLCDGNRMADLANRQFHYHLIWKLESAVWWSVILCWRKKDTHDARLIYHAIQACIVLSGSDTWCKVLRYLSIYSDLHVIGRWVLLTDTRKNVTWSQGDGRHGRLRTLGESAEGAASVWSSNEISGWMVGNLEDELTVGNFAPPPAKWMFAIFFRSFLLLAVFLALAEVQTFQKAIKPDVERQGIPGPHFDSKIVKTWWKSMATKEWSSHSSPLTSHKFSLRLVEVGVGAGVNFPYFKEAGVKEASHRSQRLVLLSLSFKSASASPMDCFFKWIFWFPYSFWNFGFQFIQTANNLTG